MLRRVGQWCAAPIAALVMGCIYLVALALGATQLGRLLRSVSVPRMREHRLRTTLTTLGIALGVAVVVGVVLVGHTIELGVVQTVDELAGKADLQIGAGANGFDENLLDRVRGVAVVYKLTPAVQQIATLRTRSGQRERLLVVGVDFLGNDDTYFRSYASNDLADIRRDPLSFLNSSTNLILSRAVAKRLELRAHDKVAIATSQGFQNFEVWGFIDNEGVGRAFGGAIALMYYPAMQVAFDRGRTIDRIDIAVPPGRDPEPVAKALETALGPGVPVERPKLRGERVAKMLKTVRMGLTSSNLVALIAGAFLVFNAISISIVQRRSEIGTLRALGTTRKQMRTLLVLEGALLGVVGSAFGVGIGVALSSSMLRTMTEAVSRLYLQQSAREVSIDIRLVLGAFVLGVGSAVLAAWFAAFGGNAIGPGQVRDSATPSLVASRSSLTRIDVIGFTLVGVSALLIALPPIGQLPVGPLAGCGLLILGGSALMPLFVHSMHRLLTPWLRRRFGPEATLASNNLTRDLSRTANMAAGLMVSIALTISSAAFTASVIASLSAWSAQSAPGDLFVTSGASLAAAGGGNTPLDDSLTPALRALPGVERVRRSRSIDIDYKGSPVKVISTDVQVFAERSHFSALEGTSEQIARELREGAVAVSENFSRVHDVHLGDQLALAASDGTRQFRVAGVILDYTSDIGTITLDRATYVSAWHDSRIDTYELHLARGAAAHGVRKIIDEKLSSKYDLFVLTNREYRAEFLKAIESASAPMVVFEAVTLLVAMLGLVTATFANVLDRVRELGVLRALGMLRTQVRKMVVFETTFVGFIGTVAGCLLGIVAGYVVLRRVANVQIGWYLPFSLPIRALIEVTVITLPIAALAGFFPARRAADLVVTEALDYE